MDDYKDGQIVCINTFRMAQPTLHKMLWPWVSNMVRWD